MQVLGILFLDACLGSLCNLLDSFTSRDELFL